VNRFLRSRYGFDDGVSIYRPVELKAAFDKWNEMDRVLGRVFDRYRVPAVLHLAIWNRVDVGKCLGCDMFYPKTIMNDCPVFGYSSCPGCIPSHFSITLKHERVHSIPVDEVIWLLHHEIGQPNLHFPKGGQSSTHFVFTGFSKAQVDPIRESLEKLRESEYILLGMEIEYVEGVFEIE
jgi:hypothetical protein